MELVGYLNLFSIFALTPVEITPGVLKLKI